MSKEQVEALRAEARSAGLKKYEPRIPCKRGHIAPRYVRNNSCSECHKIHNVRWSAANREHHLQQMADWRDKNKDHHRALSKAWKERNTDKVRAAARERHKKDPIRSNSARASARPKIVRNKPPWVKQCELIPFYVQAREISEQTGIPHEVDHIVPIKGLTPEGNRVSGLHVPWNLTVCTRYENRSKWCWVS